VAACERWAREHGYKRMALDVAEPAVELRALHRSLGYVDVSTVQWDGKSYRSVVMEKPLDQSPLREHLRTLARYNRGPRASCSRHVDALPDADYRRDAGLFFKSIHGTLNHLLLAEHEVWYRRFAEGGVAGGGAGHRDRARPRRLRERLVEGGAGLAAADRGLARSAAAGHARIPPCQGDTVVLPFAATLAHVFNHGTHHRGQVTAALTAMGRPCPELDMALMLVQENAE
jgi:uncharacterized damage-inducible protein DinB